MEIFPYILPNIGDRYTLSSLPLSELGYYLAKLPLDPSITVLDYELIREDSFIDGLNVKVLNFYKSIGSRDIFLIVFKVINENDSFLVLRVPENILKDYDLHSIN